MGFSAKCLTLLSENKDVVIGKTVLSLGNPFIGLQSLANVGQSKSELLKLMQIEPKARAHYFFEDILGAESFKILDVSDEEGADIIKNLNVPITEEVLDKFDVILDLGTQEHIFNLPVYYENLIKLTKKNALMLFDLPANGFLEHGFRQYSPTFFYDLCWANKKSLSLRHLSLYMPSKTVWVDVIELYKKIDSRDYSYTCGPTLDHKALVKLDIRLIGTIVNLFSKRSPVGIISAIIKLNECTLTFDVLQANYRLNPLSVVLPRKKSRLESKTIIKTLINCVPLPMAFLVKILTAVSFFMRLGLSRKRR